MNPSLGDKPGESGHWCLAAAAGLLNQIEENREGDMEYASAGELIGVSDSIAALELERPDQDLILVSEQELDCRNAAIDFRSLRYFVAVAEELHFGRAAERLYVSQPALSQAIARLEAALGVRLLKRSRHHVEHTAAGAELLRRARRLLCDKNETIERVRSLGNGTAGILRLGVAMLAEHAVEPALTSLTATHPVLVVDRVGAVSERLLAQLREGRLEVAFVHRVPVLSTIDELAWEVVRRRRLMALVGRAHPLASNTSIRLEQLRDETFLVNPRELAPSAYDGVQLMCRQFGGFDARLLESQCTSTLPHGHDLRLIRNGTAIALITEDTARDATPDLTATVGIEPPPASVIALAWRRRDSSPMLERFLDFVRTFRDQHRWTSELPADTDRLIAWADEACAADKQHQ
jgi:DNA-binding transcriptional LysR family regulator